MSQGLISYLCKIFLQILLHFHHIFLFLNRAVNCLSINLCIMFRQFFYILHNHQLYLLSNYPHRYCHQNRSFYHIHKLNLISNIQYIQIHLTIHKYHIRVFLIQDPNLQYIQIYHQNKFNFPYSKWNFNQRIIHSLSPEISFYIIVIYLDQKYFISQAQF